MSLLAEINVKDAVAAIGVFVGASGFLFGLIQYMRGQNWKRSEFAAKQLELLATDSDLSLCCKLLNWSVLKMPVPEQYQKLTEDNTFLHNWYSLEQAMLASETGKFDDWQHVLYRDLFDNFFDYLERINLFISNNLISKGDVRSLMFWLNEIANPRFSNKPVFVDFIFGKTTYRNGYGYPGVIQLLKKFGIKPKGADLFREHTK